MSIPNLEGRRGHGVRGDDDMWAFRRCGGVIVVVAVVVVVVAVVVVVVVLTSGRLSGKSGTLKYSCMNTAGPYTLPSGRGRVGG